jgi:hypothetical protein
MRLDILQSDEPVLRICGRTVALVMKALNSSVRTQHWENRTY